MSGKGKSKTLVLTDEIALLFGKTGISWLREKARESNSDIGGDFLRFNNLFGNKIIVNDAVINWQVFAVACHEAFLVDPAPEGMVAAPNRISPCVFTEISDRLCRLSDALVKHVTDDTLRSEIDGYLTLKFNRLLEFSALSTLSIDSFIADIHDIKAHLLYCEKIDGSLDGSELDAPSEHMRDIFRAVLSNFYQCVYITSLTLDKYENLVNELATDEFTQLKEVAWTPVFNFECGIYLHDKLLYSSFKANVEITSSDIAFSYIDNFFKMSDTFSDHASCVVIIDNPNEPQKEWEVYRTIRNTYYVAPAIAY